MQLRPTALLANAIEGFLVVDGAGRFTYANPAAEKILGTSSVELARSWRDWKTTATDGSPLPVEELPLLRVVRTGEPTAHAEHTFQRPDGTKALLSQDATLLRDEAGTIEGAVASLVDLTEQRAEKERVRRVEDSFRAFAERSPEGVVMHRDGRTVYVNPAAVRMLGYSSPVELIGRSVFDLIHPDDHVGVRERIQAVLQGDASVPPVGERLLHRDGHTIDVEISAFPTVFEGEAIVMAVIVDVSELKRTLGDLKRSVSVLRATLESTADGILVVDERGGISAYNAKFVEMWRIPQAIMDAGDDTRALDFVLDHLSDPAGFMARTRELYGDPEAASYDMLELRDGRAFERYSLPQRIDGRCVGRVWSFRDVSEARRSEAERERLLAELAAKHELMKTVFDHAPVSMCLLRGPDLCYELVNPTYEQLFGFKQRVGKPYLEVASEAGRELAPVLREVLATGVAYRAVDKPYPRLRDGTVEEGFFWVNALRVPSPKGDGVLTLAVDTTEQVLARRRIEDLAAVAVRQAAEIQSIHASMVDSIVVCDAGGLVTHLNAACTRLTGVGEEAVGGTLADYTRRAELHHMNGELIAPEELPLARALQGETLMSAAFWSEGTGRQIFLRCDATAMRDPDGEIVGAVTVERDVSGIIEFDMLKDQFIRVAAHELKTPVAIMKGYADVLLRSTEGLPPTLVGGLEAIDRGAKRIDRVVGGLLDVSQLQLGKMTMRFEKVELAEVVEMAARRHAMVMTKHRIRVSETQPVIVQADRKRLEQVLETLLDNATRYSPRGGDVDVELTVRHDRAVVSIADHGVGIPAAKQARIFERFYRAHTDTPHDYGGLGVGLYISREIVARHGGEIWFTSEEGSGSRFCFSLRV